MARVRPPNGLRRYLRNEAAGDDDDDAVDPEDQIARDAGIEDWYPGAGKEYFRRKRAAINACPVEFILHCSDEFPMWVLAVRGTAVTAFRGSPREVDMPQVEEARIEAFRAWVDERAPGSPAPGWLLFSMWG